MFSRQSFLVFSISVRNGRNRRFTSHNDAPRAMFVGRNPPQWSPRHNRRRSPLRSACAFSPCTPYTTWPTPGHRSRPSQTRRFTISTNRRLLKGIALLEERIARGRVPGDPMLHVKSFGNTFVVVSPERALGMSTLRTFWPEECTTIHAESYPTA